MSSWQMTHNQFYFDTLLYENYNDTLEGPLSREAMKENDPMKFIKRSGDITVRCIPAFFSWLTVSWRCTRMIRMKMTQLKLEASDAGEHLQKVGIRVEVKLILLQRQICIVLLILQAYRELFVLFLAKFTAI